MLDYNNFNGFLFIGDPHVDSRTPGKRQDEFFFNTVCEKLEQCAKISKEKNLFPVILGDLLNRKKDSDPRMIVRLVKALKTFPTAPITLVGNHEKNHTDLSHEDVLYLLKETKVLHTLEGSTPFAKFNFSGKTVLLGGTEYGKPLPVNIDVFGVEEIFDYVVWITHHDLAFANYSDELVKPYAISGIDYMINGHIHHYYPPVAVEGTIWFNPGNITRMTISDQDHIPAVYELTEFGTKKFKKHPLKYNKNIFTVSVEAEQKIDSEEAALLFTKEIKEEIKEQKTLDGSEFQHIFLADVQQSTLEPEAQQIIISLWGKMLDNLAVSK